jgi:uncharacterized protein YqeY
MSIRERVKADLKQAIEAREKATMTILRTMLGALDNAEAVTLDALPHPVVGWNNDVPRKVLSEEDFLQVLRNEAAGRRSAIATYERLGRAEEAARLRAELAVFARYVNIEDTAA